MKVGITGHQPERLHDQQEKIRSWISWYLAELHEEDSDLLLIVGDSRGVDQMAALEAIRQEIPFYYYLPYKQGEQSTLQEYIRSKAAETCYETEKFQNNSYINRDRRIVDDSDFMMVVWDGNKQGGTYQTVQYLEKQQKPAAFYPWESLNFMGDQINLA